jgi:acyl carrier protein
MAVLEFLAALEQEFHFRFPAQDLSMDLLMSRSRLVRYLTERVNEG